MGAMSFTLTWETMHDIVNCSKASIAISSEN
jgi:hypothetical protein